MVSFFEIIIEVISRLGILYLGIFAGYLFIISPLKKFRSQYIWSTINILTPFLIFVSFQSIELNPDLLYPVVSAIIVTILGIYFPKFLAKITNKEDPTPAELCTATFPNALNYPFPVIYAFAPTGLGIASIFLGLTTIARNTVGFWISGSKMDKESIKQVLLFPPIWAIVAGIGFNTLIDNSYEIVNSSVFVSIIFEVGIFATLMTVGFGLAWPKMEYVQPILRVSITRIILMFVIGILVIVMFNPPIYVAIPFLIQMSAPPAVYNGLYAEILGLDTKLTSQVIVTITLIALIILPFQLIIIEFLL